MKQIQKPIFEMVKGEYILFDNIIYNYIAMAIIGLIAYRKTHEYLSLIDLSYYSKQYYVELGKNWVKQLKCYKL